SEHYDVGAVSEVAEFGCEQAARFGTVAKTPLGGEWSRPGSDRVEKMRREPARPQSRHILEGSRLLEKMRGSGNHLEARHPGKPLQRATIEREDKPIVTPDDEQCRRVQARQPGCCQVGTTTARDHGRNGIRRLGGGDERGCGAGAGSKVT